MSQILHLPNITFELRDDGILHIKLSDNVHITEEDVYNLNHQITEITNGKSTPVMIEYGAFNTFTDEALSCFATQSVNKADALILNDSVLLTVLAEHYLKINKPTRPTKLFYNTKDGIDWLKQFVD
jgi:hypothetical protein